VTGSASVVDVARQAGVSVGTVSNVLNRPERVSPVTRERVLRAIEELGFVRNEAARQLRSGRSRTIGLIVPDVGNPFFTDLAAGVESAASAAGLSVVLCNSCDDQTREDHYLSLLQEQRSYGILITPVGEKSKRIAEVRRRGIAVVFADRRSGKRQCSVSVDDVVGGELAAAHLIALGHRRVAFVGGPLTTRQVADRLAGARAAVHSARLSPDVIMLMETVELNFAAGRHAGEQIAAMPQEVRPTAAFCANDLVAIGVLQEMTRRSLRVPADLAIVGYDDIEFAASAAVPLSSVRQPRAQLGQAAAELLIEEVSAPDPHHHRQIVFEPELIVRMSTDRDA
jgi:LacI family transcriptional regulator